MGFDVSPTRDFLDDIERQVREIDEMDAARLKRNLTIAGVGLAALALIIIVK
jgi:hypothetical protein